MSGIAKALVPVGFDSTRRIVSALCALFWATALFGLIAWLANSLVPLWVLLIIVLTALTLVYLCSLPLGQSSSDTEPLATAATAEGSKLPPMYVSVTA